MSPVREFVLGSRHRRETLEAYELFPVPVRLGGQGASHLVSHRRGPSDQGPMGQGRQRVYPLDGRAHIAPKRSDARRCHGRFARRTRYPFVENTVPSRVIRGSFLTLITTEV